MAHHDRDLRAFETKLYFPGNEDASEAQVSEVFHLQRESTDRSTAGQPVCSSRARVAPLFATLLGAAGSCAAQDAAAQKANERLQEVVVEARRQATDEQVTRQVQQTLTDDPWMYAEHVVITTRNGIVTLEGLVGDNGERFRMLRLCRKIPGVRRVVDALEKPDNDADGG